MNLFEFNNLVNANIKNKTNDKILFSYENRVVRGQYLFNLLYYINKILNFFKIKNNLFFTNGKIFIEIDGVFLELLDRSYLKVIQQKYSFNPENIFKFLKKNSCIPKTIIDIGACWGLVSFIFAKEYKDSQIYAVEGSPKNYSIMKSNLSFYLNNFKNIKFFNYIISNNNNYKFISNYPSSENKVIDESVSVKNKIAKVKSIKLSTFLKSINIDKIDLIKLDIEGHELEILDDFLSLEIKYGVLEVLKEQGIEKNVDFLNKISNKFYLFDIETLKKISKHNFRDYINGKLSKKLFFDILIKSKKLK
jgi:FkbM family methyltransferase|tara:strand:+ start:922 stop:1839 length:918 start_codon:yes stop_codon:yes gene_type:complete